MKSGMKHEAVEMYGVCQSISSQHVTNKTPGHLVFVFQTEVGIHLIQTCDILPT